MRRAGWPLHVDHAASVLRKAGIEVEIIDPPKVMQFWAYVDLQARLFEMSPEDLQGDDGDRVRDLCDDPWLGMA